MIAIKKPNGHIGGPPHPTNPLNSVSAVGPQNGCTFLYDQNICWAAAASNVLQWWQDTRSDLKSTTPNGKSATYDVMPQVAQLAIYQTISTNWTNSGGPEQAYNWWVNGGMLDTTAYPSLSTTTAPGGYWKELGPTVPGSPQAEELLTTPLIFRIQLLGRRHQKRRLPETDKQHQQQLGNHADRRGEEGKRDAITMWGYDTDKDGNLIIYLTDSDATL